MRLANILIGFSREGQARIGIYICQKCDEKVPIFVGLRPRIIPIISCGTGAEVHSITVLVGCRYGYHDG